MRSNCPDPIVDNRLANIDEHAFYLLVDFIFPGSGNILDDHIRAHISVLLKDDVPRKGLWKRNVDVSPSAHALV